MEQHSENIVRTNEVIGVDVKSPQLESLGEIKEIVMDKLSGQGRYVVLSFGGFLGFGDNYFAFPWKSISYNNDEECFILNVSKDKLKKEYGFDKDHWPDMTGWANTIDSYYR